MNRNLLYKIIWDNTLNYRFTRHFVFWALILLYFTSFGIYKNNGLFYLKMNLVFLVPDMIATYGIIYFIFPRFLFKKQYIKSILYLLILIILYWLVIRTCYSYILPFLFDDSKYLLPKADMSFFKQILLESETPLIIFCSAVFLKTIKHWHKVDINNRDLEKKELENKMTLLTAQLHPHFLFNTLNNLYSLSIEKSDKAPEIIMKLSEVMRYILDDYDKLNVNLDKELEVIESYIKIEKLRYDEDLKVILDVKLTPDEQEQIQIPPLLIFTFIENAFKHGVSNSLNNPWINILIKKEGVYLKFYFENSIDCEYKTDKRSGVGLGNVKKRLKLYYPNKYRYSTNKLNDRYKVFLELKI